MKKMLYWWLIVCVIGVGAYITYAYNLLIPLYSNDITHLTYLITLILGLTTISIGYKAFKKRSMQLEWFASDVVLSLGMIGTIVGFMVMLYGTFSQIDVTDMASVRAVLAAMTSGLYTALSTTLLGLISSVLIKCQISILDPEDR
jgi:small-conductance mechanosensitive channel